MDKITLIFTKNNFSIFSWVIRWTLCASRFKLAQSSHVYIVDDKNNKAIEANLLYGVREVNLPDVIFDKEIIKKLEYTVTDYDAGMHFLRSQLGKKYDYRGAFGIGLAPDRNWQEDDSWFCYELGAATLKAAGLDIFNDVSHITESQLFSIKSTDITDN